MRWLTWQVEKSAEKTVHEERREIKRAKKTQRHPEITLLCLPTPKSIRINSGTRTKNRPEDKEILQNTR